MRSKYAQFVFSLLEENRNINRSILRKKFKIRYMSISQKKLYYTDMAKMHACVIPLCCLLQSYVFHSSAPEKFSFF